MTEFNVVFNGDSRTAFQLTFNDNAQSHIPVTFDENINVPQNGYQEEIDPTVPDWAKQPEKPTYTAAEVGAYTKAETERAIQLAVSNGGIPSDSSGILMIDRATGTQYVLYVENGKLSMEKKIAEVIAAICGMTLCGQTVCGGV